MAEMQDRGSDPAVAVLASLNRKSRGKPPRRTLLLCVAGIVFVAISVFAISWKLRGHYSPEASVPASGSEDSPTSPPATIRPQSPPARAPIGGFAPTAQQAAWPANQVYWTEHLKDNRITAASVGVLTIHNTPNGDRTIEVRFDRNGANQVLRATVDGHQLEIGYCVMEFTIAPNQPNSGQVGLVGMVESVRCDGKAIPGRKEPKRPGPAR